MGEYRHVVGLDLSLSGTGVAVHNFETGHTTLAVAKSEPRSQDLRGTLHRIHQVLGGVRMRTPAGNALAVVEAPSYRSQFGKPHERAGLWWAVVLDLVKDGYDVVQIAPRARAKYIAGHLPVEKPRSGPSKREIVTASTTEFPHHPELVNDNIADAFGLARIGARYLGAPIDSSTPKRLEVMANLGWPEREKEEDR